MTIYNKQMQKLQAQPKNWLITGVAGFIGSNLLEALLQLDQTITGLDDFSTGFQHNLEQVKASVTPEQWSRFTFLRGDIRDLPTCERACEKADYILHQAALGSVPRSIEDPVTTNQTNIDGFLNMLVAARNAKAERFVFAASSSTYGDHKALPKVEDQIGKPLSPYAITKYVNELYADVFANTYGLSYVGLRYFNIFGRRQDPGGSYAAVIPAWIASLIKGETLYINGDGETSRDFCYIDNAVQANILAATNTNPEADSQVYNVAVGDRTSLNTLYALLKSQLITDFPELAAHSPVYRDFRRGDVRHSLADISKAKRLLGYQPSHQITDGVLQAMPWYVQSLTESLRSHAA